MREKETLKRMLDKAFIVDLHLTFMDEDSLYFVFEHCHYGTLTNLIETMGGLSHEVVRHYMAEIVQALSQCFEEKIMHRDVKPENILITKSRHLKLIDFGDAKEFDDSVYDFMLES